MISSKKELVKNFSSAFSLKQSNLLSDVIYHSYSDLVKVKDFTELKDSVKDLQVKVDDQGERLDTLTVRVDVLTERVDVLTERVDELKDEVKQVKFEVKNLAKQIGGLSENFGASLEDFALDMVPEMLEKYWKMEITDSNRLELQVKDNVIEFDIFIEGKIGTTNVQVLGEVKSQITEDEVKRFLKLVQKAKPHLPNVETRVVFFGYRAYKKVKELITDEGAFMIFTNGRLL